MKPVKVNVEAWEGASREITWVHLDQYSNPVPLDGFTAVLEIRESADDEGEPKLRATTENGLLSIDAAKGELTLTLDRVTTEYNGKYDYFLIDPDDVAWYIVLPSTFKVIPTVTHEDE